MIDRTKGGSVATASALAVTVILVGGLAQAAVTPQQKCESGKNHAAGKYAACIGKAEKALVAGGDMIDYDEDIARCASKLLASWTKLESPAGCPSMGDGSAIEEFVDVCMEAVALSLGGAALPPDVVTCNADLDACDDSLATCSDDVSTCNGDLATTTADLGTCQGEADDCYAAATPGLAKTGQVTCYTVAGAVTPCAGTGQDGESVAGAPISYTDNGNGTITDNVTKLMWEKLSDDGSIHDKDNLYTGMLAAAAKAASLNGAAFGGHTDWRLPNRRELDTIVDMGRTNPAIDPIFHSGCVAACTVLTCSCTRSHVYHTSSTYVGYTPASWKINFQDGDPYAGNRDESHYVRVVRNVY